MVVEPANVLLGLGGEFAVLLFGADQSQQVESEIVLGLLPVSTVSKIGALAQEGTGEPDQQITQMFETEPTRQQVVALVGNRKPDQGGVAGGPVGAVLGGIHD